MSSAMLSPTQRYAAGGLFGMALHQAQVIQTCQLGSSSDNNDDDGASPVKDRVSSGSSSSSSSDSVSDDPHLWVHPAAGLLRPVFKFLEIDSKAWLGLEETSACSPATNHVGAFLRMLYEKDNKGKESSSSDSEGADKELALANSVDAMASSMECSADDQKNEKKEQQQEFESDVREKCSTADTKLKSVTSEDQSVMDKNLPAVEQLQIEASGKFENEDVQKPLEELTTLSYPRKVVVLYELLSGCLANKAEGNKKVKQKKGYDARHRAALRLLATWFDVKWVKMEAIETMVACTAMALLKEEESNVESQSPQSPWAKWKRGGIIGAAALTGGALMAITGGLAAPAIAAGFGALAPTLGTLVPVIGASGFAAVATAAGSVAGSVAVAASFGAAGAGLTGTKMARRIGDVDEFEFKEIGENHNQGRLAVEILISGFVFDEEDFVRPWEAVNDNLERYVLQWESKNLILISTAIQDWLTSKITSELMKQGAMLTVLSSLVAALAWPATLLAATNFIDSNWTIAIDRSDKAGILLAEVLLKGLQGGRPVTLVGFSLGARVIFKCLETLAKKNNGAELVERVVLLGAPISIRDEDWEAARKVVAGRFINVYSTNDWMLGVAFRASLLTKGLAGIQPADIPGIENVDATELIERHSAYLWAAPQILEQLEIETSYPILNRSVIKKK